MGTKKGDDVLETEMTAMQIKGVTNRDREREREEGRDGGSERERARGTMKLGNIWEWRTSH